MKDIAVCLLTVLLLATACTPKDDDMQVSDLHVERVPAAEAPAPAPSSPVAQVTAGSNVQTTPVAKEFNVQAFKFGFDPATITVTKGDHVKITFTSTDGTHGVALEGYGVSTDSFSQGQSRTLEFTADKAGTFTFFCDVYCGSGHSGMKGQLIVK